jgi:hypothetical protein
MYREAVPLFVASFGRSGSTALMRALGAVDQIVVPAAFPYEARVVQYILAAEMLRLTGAAPPRIEWSGASYTLDQGTNPVARDWLAAHRQTLFSRPDLLADYAALLLPSSRGDGPNDRSPVFLAEKAVGLGLVSPALEGNASRRAIVLLRDPRDVFISVKAFNRRRGFLAFGESADPAADGRMLHAIVAFGLTAAALAGSRPDQAHIVRYQDMVRIPHAALADLLAWLGISYDPALLAAMAARLADVDAQAAQHMTSAGAVDSVGRWRTIPPGSRFLDLFAEHADAIRRLGYPDS